MVLYHRGAAIQPSIMSIPETITLDGYAASHRAVREMKYLNRHCQVDERRLRVWLKSSYPYRCPLDSNAFCDGSAV